MTSAGGYITHHHISIIVEPRIVLNVDERRVWVLCQVMLLVVVVVGDLMGLHAVQFERLALEDESLFCNANDDENLSWSASFNMYVCIYVCAYIKKCLRESSVSPQRLYYLLAD